MIAKFYLVDRSQSTLMVGLVVSGNPEFTATHEALKGDASRPSMHANTQNARQTKKV